MSDPLTTDPELDANLGYLLRLAYQRFRAALDDALQDLGLSAQEYVVLSVFETRPELSTSELARITQVTRQTMHAAVLELETAGLIERIPKNQRVVLVRPTNRGRRTLAAATDRVRGVEQTALAGLSHTEEGVVRTWLADIAAAQQHSTRQARETHPTMTLEYRIRTAEADLFDRLGAEVDESFLDLANTGVRVRLLSHGSGPPLVLLHGVSLSAAAWAPLFSALSGWRVLAVDLPGHGLSDPDSYRCGQVRQRARELIDDIFDALGLDEASVVGHSLGGMFAIWHAAAGTERISRLVAIGEPAVALPGVRVRMPLSVLTVRGLGLAVLRSPSPRPVYRRLLAQGLGRAEVAAAPDSLIDALRLSARRPGNARTVSSLMHAIDHFRRPRPESVLTTPELRAIAIPTMFIWGASAPYLTADRARPSIDRIPGATLHEVPGGHGPWLVDTERSAELIRAHLTTVGVTAR